MNNPIKTRDDLLTEALAEINLVGSERALSLIAEQALVLDVREPVEFQLGHLPNAINISRGVLEFKVDDHPDLHDHQRNILIYCKNGGRSTLAAYTLKQMGFSQVERLIGGFDGWSGTIHKIEKAESA
ncbi:MAG: rhodanese-related sulfurtransferase [Oleispira sp.]|jgi:rhodanese-related sulfurtransferase